MNVARWEAWTVLPITHEEARELSRTDEAEIAARLNALAPARRSLHRDSPKGGPDAVTWRKGIDIPPI